MPLDPTPAQSAASRANGSLGRGPTSAAGKACSALNGASHGLAGSAFVLRAAEQVRHDRLQAELIDHYRLEDVQALALVESLARSLMLQHRLEELEMAVLNDALGLGRAQSEEGQPEEGQAAAPRRLPSLASLCRYRARLEQRELVLHRALADLRAMQDEEAAVAAGPPTPAGTSEPERRPQPPARPRSTARNAAARRRWHDSGQGRRKVGAPPRTPPGHDVLDPIDGVPRAAGPWRVRAEPGAMPSP